MFPKARFRSDRFTSDLTHTLASHGLWRGHHAVGCPCLLNSSLCLFAVVSSDKCASRHVVANCSILDGSLHPLTASCVRIRICLYSMRLSSIHYPKLPLSNHNHAPVLRRLLPLSCLQFAVHKPHTSEDLFGLSPSQEAYVDQLPKVWKTY
jgi:hypothetical protein